MATLDVIRRLTLRATSEGFDKAKSDVQSLGQVYDSSAKRQVSMEKSLQGLERRFVDGARQAQEFSRVQQQIQRIIAQHPQLQERANRVLAEATKQLTNQSGVIRTLNFEMQNLAGSLGRVGPLIAAIGPAGLAAAAALGAAALAVKFMADEALKLGDRAGQLIDLSDSIGLTVKQIQGLEIAGAQVGLTAERLGPLFERFASSMAEIRTNTGQAVEAINRVSPALLQQLRATGSLSEAVTVLFNGMQQLDKTERLFVSRSLFGRGGAGVGRLAELVAAKGGLDAFVSSLDQADFITRRQAEGWDRLTDTIRINLQLIQQNIVSTFAGVVLEAMQRVTRELLEISRLIKTLPTADVFDLLFRSVIDGRLIDAFRQLIAIMKAFAEAVLGTVQVLASIKNLDPFGPEAQAGAARIKQAYSDANVAVTALSTNLRNSQSLVTDPGGLFGQTPRNELQKTGDAAEEAGEKFNGLATDLSRSANKIRELREALARESELVFLSREDAQIAERLKDLYPSITDAINSSEAAQIRFNNRIMEAQDLAGDFLNDFISGMLEGKSVTESLTEAMDSLGQSISRAATKQIGESIISSLGSSAISKSIGSGLGNLFGSGSAIGGALGSFGGPLVGLAVGTGISLLSRLFGDDDQEAQQRAQEFNRVVQQSSQNVANLIGQLKQLNQTTDNSVKSAIENARELRDQTLTEARTVISTLSLQQGQVAFTAADLQASAQAFQALNEATSEFNKFVERTIREARDALRGETALSPIAKQMKELQDTADDLIAALIDTGTSAAEAARVISEDLTIAMDRLRSSVETDLVRRINEATGRGWINQLTDLMTEVHDAQALGVDPGILGDFLRTQAQAIVDSANLTGEAFDELLRLFPELANVVKEASESIKRTTEEIARSAQSLEDRLFAAITDTSTIEGRLAAFDRAAQREREEEARLGGENMILLEATLATERARIIDDFNREAVEAERQAALDRENAINQSAKNIVDYVNSLFAGGQAGVSPLQQLASAQATYTATLQLAQQGNIDAMNRITQDAENLRQALRAVYGSSLQYQQGVQQIASDLLSLPAVQETTDPVVQAIRDSIIELQDIVLNTGDTVLGVGTTNTSLSTTNSNLDSIENINSFQSTILSSIEGYTNATQQQAQATANLVSATNSLLNTISTLTQTLVNLQTTANASLTVQQAQLTLLNTNLTMGGASSSANQAGQIFTADNPLLVGINKIVINTAATAFNTMGTWQQVAGQAIPSARLPIYQAGGWIRGGIWGHDSVGLAAGGLGMPGEFVVRRNVAERYSSPLMTLNSSGYWPANDNAAVLMELRQLRRDLMAALVANAQHIREGVENVGDSLDAIARENTLQGQAA